MIVITKTMEEIVAFSDFDLELEWFPIYNQTTQKLIPNAWFNFIGHFWQDLNDDYHRSHFEFDFISLN